MDAEFLISRTGDADWQLTRIAPQAIDHDVDLWVPLRMQRQITYPGLDLKVMIDLVFSGERLEIFELKISSATTFIATQFLTSLSLPKVIRTISIDSIPNSSRWLSRPEKNEDKDLSYRCLAEMYWFEHISWGAPRSAIMKYTGWSRANTNWHLRRIAKEYPLPGPHAAQFSWLKSRESSRKVE